MSMSWLAIERDRIAQAEREIRFLQFAQRSRFRITANGGWSSFKRIQHQVMKELREFIHDELVCIISPDDAILLGGTHEIREYMRWRGYSASERNAIWGLPDRYGHMDIFVMCTIITNPDGPQKRHAKERGSVIVMSKKQYELFMDASIPQPQGIYSAIVVEGITA